MMATAAYKDQRFPAHSGGIDWNLRLRRGEYAIDGYLAGSHAVSPLLTSSNPVTGSAGRIGLSKVEAEHWLAYTTYDFSTRNFEINDLGFYSQPREHGGYTQFTFKEDHASGPIWRYFLSLQSDYRWNWDGINTAKQIEFEPVWEFRNFWTLLLNYIHELPAYDDANRGIRGLYQRPSRNRFTLTLQTDIRKPVVLALHAGYHNSTKNLNTLFSAMEFTLRPNTWMEFSPALIIVRTRNEEAWVIPFFTDDGYNLFGDRDVDEYDFSLRGTITFTRTLSLQFFTQVFLAKGRYTNFKKLLGSNNLPDYDYLNSPVYTNPDFNQQVFNANLVLRWEYLPGSTFYLVWTQARSGNNGMFERSLSDNISDTFRLPMDNAILAKITYWWSL